MNALGMPVSKTGPSQVRAALEGHLCWLQPPAKWGRAGPPRVGATLERCWWWPEVPVRWGRARAALERCPCWLGPQPGEVE